LTLIAVTFVSLHGQIFTVNYIVRTIKFEGNETLSTNDLKEVLKLKEPILWNSTEFNRRSLKLDAFSLRNYYISKGFLEVEVEESFETLNDNAVDIVLTFVENDQQPDAKTKEEVERRLEALFYSYGKAFGLKELRAYYGEDLVERLGEAH